MTDLTTPDLESTALRQRSGLGQSLGVGTSGRAHAVWLVHRVAVAIAGLVAISVLIFAATQVLPGNAAVQLLGRNASPQNIRIVDQQLGLNRSLVQQYWTWAFRLLHGNLGASLAGSHPRVGTIIGPALLNSTVLVAFAVSITIVVSLVWGIWAAVHRGRVSDIIFHGVTFLFTAVPEFVVGLVLVILFATSVTSVLPAISFIPAGTSPFAQLDAFVLPVTCLVLATMPYLARLVRGSMIDELGSEYVRLAQLKGLSQRRVIFAHALPNAIVPAIQGTAVTFGYLAGGIVVVEYVFGFPGIGTIFLNAIDARDVSTVQAAGLILASVYIVVNLLADLLVFRLSPRLWTATE
ncbi:MAG: ABC transporter permease [Solirubrobacteraceae bacterium]